MNATQINFSLIAPEVVRELLGEPKEIKGSDWRYNQKGSLSVDVEKATFYSHEEKEGGGLLELIKRKTGKDGMDWLREKGFIEPPAFKPCNATTTAPAPHNDAEHIYTTANGEPVYKVVRRGRNGKRTFTQARFDNGKWISGVKDVTRLPYRLTDIVSRPTDTVFIVEGEKDADTLAAIGLVATCNSGGAGNWRPELSEYFTGRDVVVITDNDEVGRNHGKKVVDSLLPAAKSVRFLDLSVHWPGMPAKGDVSDFLLAGGTVERLKTYAAAAPLQGVSACTAAPRTYADIFEAAKATDKTTAPKEVESLVAETATFSTLEQRRIFEEIKRNTGVPLGDLKAVLSENSTSKPDQLALAIKVINSVGSDNILSAGSHFYQWDVGGVWRLCDDRTVKQLVQRLLPAVVGDVNRALVDGVADLLRTEIHKPFHEFNVGNPETVNCLNGELSLINGKWTLEQHRLEHYRTTQIPVEYDPDAQAQRFFQFLVQIFSGDDDAADKVIAILEMIGYTLMAHCRHERFIILVGIGANGKSVLLAILEALCGLLNVAGVQPSQFDRTFQRAHLHGKLANIVTEIKQGEVIDDASLKGIVSGEPTTVEHKFGHPFVMHPFATCWFGTNHMPHTRDFSDALFRRALVVQFNNVFKPELGNCDPSLKDKLMAELPGILNLALEAYGAALERGFTMPASSVRAREEWRLEADQVAQFVEDQCTRDPLGEVQASVLFRDYERWASECGIHKRLTMKSFRDRLTRLGFGEHRRNHGRMVTGISVQR